MREIIFRGKRIDNGKWVDGCLFVDDKGEKNEILNGYVNYRIAWEVDPETVGQYTGIDDKNGKKIFEGDIIKFGISRRLMYVHMNEETLTWELTDVGVPAHEVNHLLNTFDLGEIQIESAYGKVVSKIVGNVHDNPGLLKGGADNG